METLCSLRELKNKVRVWLLVIIALTFLPVTVLAGEVAGSGNDDAGKKLFTGETRFANGGPPCMSCHNAGVGVLGGGSLGPDLTLVWPNKPFLINDAWINAKGIPVMGPIFSEHNITPEEVEDLKAFFSVQAATGVAGGKQSTFVVGGLIGFVIIFVAFSIIWSGRYRSRNRGTAHDDLWRNYSGKGGGN